MTARYAIYFVPPEDHPLYSFGQHLLGRDAHLTGPLAQPALENIDPTRLATITEAPRFYGFHATLKPPFRLADQQTPEALHAAAEQFAARHSPFKLPPLEVAVLDRFIALRTTEMCPPLNLLANNCVRDFDAFRAPPAPEELTKRRAAGLTPRQDHLLTQWGYPYVLDEFRFHLSLTGRLDSDSEREIVLQSIKKICPPDALANLPVNAISVFGQPDTEIPFHQTQRFPFGG